MAYIYDLVDNWNNAGVTFTAIKMNVTDTASAAGSLLMDLQVGGASRFSVDKSGRFMLPVTIVGGTQTTSVPALDLSQTWNASGTTFTGLKFNVTDTASASVSLLMDLQVGGSSLFNVTKIGAVNAVNSFRVGGVSFFTAAGISFQGDLLLQRRAAANLCLGAADTSASATITVTIASPGVVTWSSHGLTTGTPVVFSTTGALPTGITAGTTYYVIAVDTNTFQIATSFANALAGTAVNTSGSQSGTHTGRRGAIAQTLGVQDTLSTGSLTDIDGADFVIRGSRGIGNKPGGSIIFQVARPGSSGTAQNALVEAFRITPTIHSLDIILSSEGNLIAPSTNPQSGNRTILGHGMRRNQTTFGINFFYGESVNVSTPGVDIRPVGGSHVSNGILFRVCESADASTIAFQIKQGGVFQFGGTTSSFPAIKRSSTSLQVRLADDSGDADLTAGSLSLSNTLTVKGQTIEQKAFVISYVFGGI